MRTILPGIPLLIAAACTPGTIQAPTQADAPPALLEAVASAVDLQIGEQLRKGAWRLSETANPDIYTVALSKGESKPICFISGERSLCRTVRIGDSYDFTITYGGRSYPQRIVGTYVPPMARFDAAYQAAHRGKTRIQIPEVYELVNIAIALTPTAEESAGLVVKDTPYYQEVMAHFGPLKEHPLVMALEREMRASPNGGAYFPLKMNAYAFEYDSQDQIVRSRIYDRTGFSGSTKNNLVPYLEEMRDFSTKSGFRDFYARQQSFYQSQIAYLQKEIDVAEMLAWLGGHFPDVRPYDTVNIIFSPLVGWNQSLTWMEDASFKELQPHVNFPYPGKADKNYSAEAAALRRGYILFTELNHGFINPTADRYAERIGGALSNRERWATKGKPSDSYGSPYALFTEMMNWGLVSLYLVDKAPVAERDLMIERLAPYMANRGFPQFPAFNAFLVDLYRKRPSGTTIADLYPRIIEWFEERNRSSA